jgi:hypothetical protein
MQTLPSCNIPTVLAPSGTISRVVCFSRLAGPYMPLLSIATVRQYGPAVPRYVGLRSNREVAATLLVICVQWLKHVPYVMYAGAATFPV